MMTRPKLRRVEPPEVRRSQILKAAKASFCERGFHVTTTADIASEAGVSVGLLYRHFPSKTDIIAAIVEDDLAAQLQVVQDGLKDATLDNHAALDAVIRGFTRLAEDRQRARLMMEIAAEVSRNEILAEMGDRVEREVILALKERFLPDMAYQDAAIRVQMTLNILTAIGIQTFRRPDHAEEVEKLGAIAIRKFLDMDEV